MAARYVAALLMAVLLVTAHGGGRRPKVAVSKHLQRVNKRPVKSIKSPDGDIIDCVRTAHQLAFDLPSLQNHTIQMFPSFHPEGLSLSSLNSEDSSDEDGEVLTQLWQTNGRCPRGTVPIRRTSEEDVARAGAGDGFGMKKKSSFPLPQSVNPASSSQSGHQHAIVYVQGGKYYGAKGVINVWQPEIQQSNEFSLSQIWVLGGAFGQDLNSIEAGWQVSPDLYGDNRTRLFTYWTSDAYQATGCYNLLCSGFIQINNQIAIGASIYPVSRFKGSQYEITILIWKDPKGGNWWLQFGNKYVLGYWPSFLFSNLAESASLIEWGGEVVDTQSYGQHTTTQMGSGHFPQGGYNTAAYFKNIQVVDVANKLRAPQGISIFNERPNCYNVQKGFRGKWGNYFFYGGPGRNPNCM